MLSPTHSESKPRASACSPSDIILWKSGLAWAMTNSRVGSRYPKDVTEVGISYPPWQTDWDTDLGRFGIQAVACELSLVSEGVPPYSAHLKIFL